jgi:DNA-binding HxlR family transcriptional regulator
MTQTKGYGQFCPLARAAEILSERWTLLIVRELLCGSVRFNQLQRGVPRMSSALLSRRLKELEHAGIIERRPSREGRGWDYAITQAGRDLLPIIEGMGNWAQRWVREDLVADQNLDPDLLMWDVSRRVTGDGIPADRRFVVRFEYSGMPSSRRRYWLVFENGVADMCIKDPGFDVDLYVESSIRTMVEIWLGHESIAGAKRDGRLTLDGTRKDIAAFGRWFALSVYADAGRQPAGPTPGPTSGLGAAE